MDYKKIDRYETGYVLTIKEGNTTVIKEFYCPCFIGFKERIFELHLTFIIEHKNENYIYIKDEEMNILLPTLLEKGNMLPRPI